MNTEDKILLRQIQADFSHLQVMCYSMSNNQMKEFNLRLKKTHKIELEFENRNDFFEKVSNLQLPESQTIKMLYEIEIDSPYKHVFVCKADLHNFKITSFDELKFSNKISPIKFRHLDSRENSNEIINILLDHSVEIKKWKPVDPTGDGRKYKTEEITKKRHPVIIKIDKKCSTFSAFFPGIESGNDTTSYGASVYVTLIKNILEIAKDHFSIPTYPLSLKSVLEKTKENQHFKVVTINSVNNNTRFLFSSKGKTKHNVMEDLALHIGTSLNIDDSKALEALTSFVKNSNVEEVRLDWKKLNVTSNVRILSTGAELTFFWKKNFDQSYQVEITRFLKTVSDQFGSKETTDLWNYLDKFKTDDLIYPNDLQSTFGHLGIETIRQFISTCFQFNFIKPVYRIKTVKHLLDKDSHHFENEFSYDLASFANIYEAEDGELFDGRNPENIEIAFEKQEVKTDASK